MKSTNAYIIPGRCAEDDTEDLRISGLRSLRLLDTSDSTDNFDRITRIVRSMLKVCEVVAYGS